MRIEIKQMRMSFLFFVLWLFMMLHVKAQSDQFIIDSLSFCLPEYHEYAPSFYNNGLVFCSDRKNPSLITYRNDSKSLMSMFYINNATSSKVRDVKFFSKKLTSQLNDGPATFINNDSLLCYSSNIYRKNILNISKNQVNPMGLFFAERHGDKWIDCDKPFIFNSPEVSNITPSLTSDGKRLYFSSDRPGGYGQLDIYYSDFIDNQWQAPVNLGPEVNSHANESFPYIAQNGKLYFSSDGHKGLGGKDIFYTMEVEGHWCTPVHLSGNINSPADDFALITCDNLNSGFFSSNRANNDDIYAFHRKAIEFDNCQEQKENTFCFKFFDERIFINDSIKVVYEWDFGDGIKLTGKEVKYCFPEQGDYSVVLRVINPESGDTINNPEPYTFNLKNRIQGYINSVNEAQLDEPIVFDGSMTNLPHIDVESYFWDFGQGFEQSEGRAIHSFDKPGEYIVKLGVSGLNNNKVATKECVTKRIVITKPQ